MNKQISGLTISANTEHDMHILKMLNSLVSVDKSLNIKLFTTQYSLSIPNKSFCVLPLYEAKYSYDTMIVWDLLSLELVLDFPNLNSIVYLQDSNIPWAQNTSVPYEKWAQFFDNDKIKIITDNPNIADIFSLTWRSPILIENISPESLYENV